MISELLEKGRNELSEVTPTPFLEAEILLSHVLQQPVTYIYANPSNKTSKAQELLFTNLLQRRKKHEPIAYIVGYKDFYYSRFKTDSRALIPRPETEKIVDLAINSIANTKRKKLNIVDICTGTGCIGISIAIYLTKNPEVFSEKIISIYLSDIDEKALSLCKENKKELIPKSSNLNIEIVKSDILDYFIKNKINIDILTANPPYISKEEYSKLPPQIKKYEPKKALYSGKSSTSAIDKIYSQIKKLPAKPLNTYIESENGEILVDKHL